MNICCPFLRIWEPNAWAIVDSGQVWEGGRGHDGVKRACGMRDYCTVFT